MNSTADPTEITGTIINLGKLHNVILFNDEQHSMDEVISQIMKAIQCDISTATAMMLQAHTTGRVIVFTGHLERCEHVANILEEIRLGTKIEEA